MVQSQEPDLENHQYENDPPTTATPEDSIEPSQPDVIYAQILPSDVLPNNDDAKDSSVIYSEIMRNNQVPTAAPSDDLYAKIQKRSTLYPP